MIQVDNLTFRYLSAKIPSIKGISFFVGKGEIFGFLGPSGAGKSTTQKILIKLIHDFTGSIYIKEKNIKEWNHTFYEQIGVGFELPNHYLKLTALENLKFFGSFYSHQSDPFDLLKMVGLEKDANKRVGEFSKGMKMRLNFIRALMHNPEILFFDEPTSGLDPVNARIVKDILLSLSAEGKTIFITTHNMHDADELCDRVAFLVDGEIKEIGAPKELKAKFGEKKLIVTFKNEVPQVNEFDLEGIGTNQVFLDILKTKEILSLHTKEVNLEEVFIRSTGTRLL